MALNKRQSPYANCRDCQGGKGISIHVPTGGFKSNQPGIVREKNNKEEENENCNSGSLGNNDRLLLGSLLKNLLEFFMEDFSSECDKE